MRGSRDMRCMRKDKALVRALHFGWLELNSSFTSLADGLATNATDGSSRCGFVVVESDCIMTNMRGGSTI